MDKYKLHPRYGSRKHLISNNEEGKAVNLCGSPVLKKYPATLDTDEWEETIPAATQKDLEFIYKSNTKDAKGFPIVIIDESEPTKAAASAKGSK
ncbi:MAG: hypothetical protein KDD10_19075 [Phaeodactylibacter sp.]|nr:hypothetical protein [Phaeodactylibacter sp.]